MQQRRKQHRSILTFLNRLGQGKGDDEGEREEEME